VFPSKPRGQMGKLLILLKWLLSFCQNVGTDM
jgi:hypothetical protein